MNTDTALDLLTLDENYNADSIDGFFIGNDASACWAIEKIKEHQQEKDRFIEASDGMISYFELQKTVAQNKFENKTKYLKKLLTDYFDKVPHKKTKTQEQYELPSGNLILKKQNPEITKDEEALIENLGFTNPEFVKTSVSFAWGDFKKTLTFTADNKVVGDYDESILECIKVIPKPDVFEIKF